jgi:hypothetical protein
VAAMQLSCMSPCSSVISCGEKRSPAQFFKEDGVSAGAHTTSALAAAAAVGRGS